MLEPNDHFLEMNDDIEEMKFNSGIEDEPDPMTLAKGFKEDEMIRELEEREKGE